MKKPKARFVGTKKGHSNQAPSSTTTTTTTERAEPVVTYQQIQQDVPRYQLIEKKGDKEVYMDRQTGQKVKVKREGSD